MLLLIMEKNRLIHEIYDRLFEFFGPQRWWPGETVEEIIIGAVLTQNTSWKNVEKAIRNLKQNNALSLKAITNLPRQTLAELIKPSGYFNIKEKRLRSVAEYLAPFSGNNFKHLRKSPLADVRRELLNVHGVGRETADSILLYSLERPIFVVDAYTLRFGKRHGLFEEKSAYDEVRILFENALGEDIPKFNEYHALIVMLGKDYCRKRPRCGECPLAKKKYFLNERIPPEIAPYLF